MHDAVAAAGSAFDMDYRALTATDGLTESLSDGLGDSLRSSDVLISIPARAPQSNRFVRFLSVIGPDYALLLAFLALFIVLGMVFGAHVQFWVGSIFLAIGCTAGALVVRFMSEAGAILRNHSDARARYRRSSLEILRDWGPLVLIVIVYEHMHGLTGLVRASSIDSILYAIDLKVFGTEPTVWIGQFAHPILTDYMALAYGLYFILPMILCVSLSIRGRREDFREVVTAIVLHLCVGFLLFIVFPAGPPRFYAPLMNGGFNPVHLTGAYGVWEHTQGAWDSANAMSMRSSFPSMHCCLAVITLYYAWRFSDAVTMRFPRLFFRACVPLLISLVISTIYLRHHWVPDCLAGMALGMIVLIAVPRLRKAWPRVAN